MDIFDLLKNPLLKNFNVRPFPQQVKRILYLLTQSITYLLCIFVLFAIIAIAVAAIAIATITVSTIAIATITIAALTTG